MDTIHSNQIMGISQRFPFLMSFLMTCMWYKLIYIHNSHQSTSIISVVVIPSPGRLVRCTREPAKIKNPVFIILTPVPSKQIQIQ